ncbi:MAG: ABC transporter substrate-binding protein [Candidatus Nanopelagicaceae bacterium]|nr:ABC transporter substrate-binding protein [Candidatus Nanopelagicaceae bacterium]
MLQSKTSVKKKLLAAAISAGMVLSITSTVGPAAAAKTTLVVGSTQGLPQLNPIIRTFAFEESLFPLLWSGLSQWKPNGTVGPDLASSWKSNAKGTQWTFTIRKGVKFSDGSPLDAKAVKAVFDYAKKPTTVTQEANKIKMITKVTASGQNVIFDLSSPSALFPEAIAWIKMIKVSQVAKFNVNPATSGPYKVKSFSPNVSLVMDRNPNYYGTAAKMASVKFVKASDPTAAVTSLRSGDIDVLYQLPLADAAPLQKDKNLQLVKAKVSSVSVTWEYDMKSAPFNDIRVRQAVAYATDRAAILKSAYYGFGAVSKFNTIVPDKSAWNCGTAGGLTSYNYDLAKAKQLFADAGVSSFTWWGVAGALPEFDAMGQVLQASLKTIGIDMKIENNEVGTWAAKFYPAGKTYPGLLLPNYQSVPGEPAFSMNFLLTGRAEDNWESAKYDALYTKAIGTLDPGKRKAAWCDAMKLENSELPLITPFVFDVLHAARASVKGAWVESGGQIHLEGVSIK